MYQNSHRTQVKLIQPNEHHHWRIIGFGSYTPSVMEITYQRVHYEKLKTKLIFTYQNSLIN